jgi:3-hydroxyisobutyrate dehydrogenase
MAHPHIAFLGLGIMGGGMARRLLGAGFPLTVYNRSRGKAAPVAAAGAKLAQTPREAAQGAEIIFSMVADDAASRALWLGDDGALAGASRGAVMVECSTLTVAWVQELARAVAERGGDFVDAPVTGSKAAAAGGELNFIVGGSNAALEKIRAALSAMGRSITHLGPTGSGALVKLVNNFMAGVHVAAWAEALAWIERTELDRTKAVAFLMEGAAASPVTKVVAARMAAGDFTPNFFLRLMTKDLGYALREAAEKGITLDTAASALVRFQAAIAAGQGDEDMAAIVKSVRAGGSKVGRVGAA